MGDEEFIRKAYDIAEERDIPGWIDCFTPDGVFVDTLLTDDQLKKLFG